MTASRRTFLALAGASAGLGAGVAGATVVAGSLPGGGRSLPLLGTYVAGTERHEAPGLVAGLAPGQVVALRREPENGYDSRAISVWTPEGGKLGYLPRIQNEALAALIDAGIPTEARITGIRGSRGRPDIAVAVAIVLPG